MEWKTDELTGMVIEAKDNVSVMEVLLQRFEGLLVRVAHRYRDVSGFDEAYQEACLSFVVTVHAYEVEKGPFPAFAAAKVHGDVRSAMRRWWKAEDRQSFFGEGDDGDDATTRQLERAWQAQSEGMPDTISQWLTQQFIQAIVRDAYLSPRETFWLKGMLTGIPTPALATIAEVSQETVKTWRKRALSKLRQAARATDVN